MYLAAAEAGQLANLVDDYADRVSGDLFPKHLVLVGVVGCGPGDDADELGYFGVGGLSVDEGAEFVELAAGVLIGD